MKEKFFSLSRRWFSGIGIVLIVFLSWGATVIYFSIQWMFETWNNLTMDEVVFHLTAPLDGTNEAMIEEYLNTCITPSSLFVLLFIILLIVCRKQKRYFIILGAAGSVMPCIISGIEVKKAWDQLDAGNYVANQGTYSTFIDDYYVNPKDVQLTFPEQKRNLIYIFLESMEITFADLENGGAFQENVISELTELAQAHEDFSGDDSQLNGGYSMPGTTWTIGAMFAQTSGLPLNISIDRNYMDTQDSFFSGIVTLGDILEAEGYSQTLLIGSDATFGGRRLYFTEHGNYDIEDYLFASEEKMIPEGYKVWWGYEDWRLFEFAKRRLKELAAQDKPFNLTMLTVDTHYEDGYLCEKCQERYPDVYSNVISCSCEQVSEFVRWLMRQDFYENTTIVLAGDHPTMDRDYCGDIEDDYVRKVYVSYINPAEEAMDGTNRDYTTFDLFPTTLAAMDVSIEGNRLGLGTNLFSFAQTLTERVGIETEEREIAKKSKMLEEIASIDKDSEEVKRRYGQLNGASVAVEADKADSREVNVTVGSISHILYEISEVKAAVWTYDDRKDLQWLTFDDSSDGKYTLKIDMSDFENDLEMYKIHIYAVDSNGEHHLVRIIDDMPEQ